MCLFDIFKYFAVSFIKNVWVHWVLIWFTQFIYALVRVLYTVLSQTRLVSILYQHSFSRNCFSWYLCSEFRFSLQSISSLCYLFYSVCDLTVSFFIDTVVSISYLYLVILNNSQLASLKYVWVLTYSVWNVILSNDTDAIMEVPSPAMAVHMTTLFID